ncbi:MAG: type II secretion system protein [Betaproteobacteria bacterium]|nr:type II secretion system protein [Betaproteobacteria bacterium]
MTATPAARRSRGFTYLLLLLAVALLGLGLATAGSVWHTTVTRQKERELLWIGERYRRAIEQYYQNGPAQYPRKLTDLLSDPRKESVTRYLRKLYDDPITGSSDWGIVKAPDGGIMGVYSRSTGRPIKIAAFPPADAAFANARSYRDWKFIYVAPGQQPLAPTPR